MRFGQFDVLAAGVAQRQCALRVCAQKAAIARAVVVDEQRRLAARQPIAQQVMRHRRLFFHIVRDQVAVLPEHVIAEPGSRQQVMREDFHLERKIEQVVLQAELAEADGRVLRLSEHDGAAWLSTPGRLEPVADFRVRKTDERCLVEVVENLAVEPGTLEVNAFKIPGLAHQRVNHAGHVILRRFEREENGRLGGMRKAGGAGHARPEQIHHLPRQPADGQQQRAAAGRKVGALQFILVGAQETALRRKHQDRIARYARIEQRAQSPDGQRGLARPGWAGKENRCPLGDEVLFRYHNWEYST